MIDARDMIDETKAFDLRTYSKTKNTSDMDAARLDIIANLWPTFDVFTRMPDSVTGYTGPILAGDLPGMGLWTKVNVPHRIVWLNLTFPCGIRTRALYVPAKDSDFSNKLMVFHQGHNNTFKSGETDVLLQANAIGADVLIMWMPMLGPNDNFGAMASTPTGAAFTSHNNMQSLATATFNPLSIFPEQVIACINHALTLGRTYSKIGMVGISGGGWTTVLTAALDRRITHSYSVAGSWPNEWWQSALDYENRLPGISNIISHPSGGDYVRYTDLYLMDGYPAPRRHMSVYNRYEPAGNFPGGNSMELLPQLKAMGDERGCGMVAIKVDGYYTPGSDPRAAPHTISSQIRTGHIFPDFINN